MSENAHFSRRARAILNAQALRDWLQTTSLARVPKNQFGTASKQAICRLLHIARSSCHTNPEIRALFEKLDGRLAEQQIKSQSERKAPPQPINPELLALKELEKLQTENEHLLSELSRLRYLEDVGWELPR